MTKRFSSASVRASVLLLVALAGCASPSAPTLLDRVQSECAAGASHEEVVLTGTVVRVLGTRAGYSGAHEGFILAAQHTTLTVEDNVDLTGPIPLQRGENVTLQGQYECNDGVIHWTHHDPRGRHTGGYIEVHGTRYQ